MLGTTRLPDYNIFTCAVREDDTLLKWSIRHPRRLPGHSIDRRLFLAIQMKTALETTSRAATNTLQIATDIIESFQRYIFRFSRSPNHLFWLSWCQQLISTTATLSLTVLEVWWLAAPSHLLCFFNLCWWHPSPSLYDSLKATQKGVKKQGSTADTGSCRSDYSPART